MALMSRSSCGEPPHTFLRSLCHLLRRCSIRLTATVAAALASPLRPRHIFADMPAPPAIDVERLVKIYKAVPAVDGISFKISAGSITGLLGGNGAGKTTTIATIMGLLTPTSGRVVVL